jgi:ankyrin repeat protein
MNILISIPFPIAMNATTPWARFGGLESRRVEPRKPDSRPATLPLPLSFTACTDPPMDVDSRAKFMMMRGRERAAVLPPTYCAAAVSDSAVRQFFEDVMTDDAALLERNHAGTRRVFMVDEDGLTALMRAALHRKPRALAWLIAQGVGRASVDQTDLDERGFTALHFACMIPPDVAEASALKLSRGSAGGRLDTSPWDKPACLKLLLGAGANPLRRDVKGGWTPLHYAVQWVLPRTVRALCAVDCTLVSGKPARRLLTMWDNLGITPLAMAVRDHLDAPEIADIIGAAIRRDDAAGYEPLDIRLDPGAFGRAQTSWVTHADQHLVWEACSESEGGVGSPGVGGNDSTAAPRAADAACLDPRLHRAMDVDFETGRAKSRAWGRSVADADDIAETDVGIDDDIVFPERPRGATDADVVDSASFVRLELEMVQLCTAICRRASSQILTLESVQARLLTSARAGSTWEIRALIESVDHMGFWLSALYRRTSRGAQREGLRAAAQNAAARARPMFAAVLPLEFAVQCVGMCFRQYPLRCIVKHVDAISTNVILHPDGRGRNLVMAACMAGRRDVLRWTLAQPGIAERFGGLVDDQRCTCLHLAVCRTAAAAACLEIVLWTGAVPLGARNVLGETALHVAARVGNTVPVCKLLQWMNDAGVDIGARTVFGRTAGDEARANGHAKIADLLDRMCAAQHRGDGIDLDT